MPRPSLKDSPDALKRAPRRQVVRRATTSVRTRKVVAEPVQEIIEEDVVERRAPARFSEVKTIRRFSRRTITTIAIIVVGLISAIWIGISDDGQINVSALINERNIQVTNGEAGNSDSGDGNTLQVIPVQNSAPTIPNGGLRGQGMVNTPPVEVASSTEATTTATSTDGVSEENSSASSTEGVIESDTNTTQPEVTQENSVAPAN